MPTHVIEWAAFSLKQHVTEAALLAASEQLQDEFLDKQIGFIRRELLALGEGQYADLVTWQSHDLARQAIAQAPNYSACMSYFSLLEVDVEPKLGAPLHSKCAHVDISSIGGMEFSLFKLREGVYEDALPAAAKKMAEGLYANEDGYIGHLIVKDSSGQYADVVLASSLSRANELCQKWGSDPYADACLDYQALIEPTTIDIKFWQRVY